MWSLCSTLNQSPARFLHFSFYSRATERGRRFAFALLVILTCGMTDGLAASGAVLSVSGYVSTTDSIQHAVAATDDGNLQEIYWGIPSLHGIQQNTLGCYAKAMATTSFFTPDDNIQHTLIAFANGDIRQIMHSAAKGLTLSPVMMNVGTDVALAGFYAADDKNRIVLTATPDGSIREFFYDKTNAVHGGEVIASMPRPSKIAGFYSDDDKIRHAIIATQTGDIFEIFYAPSIGVHISQPALAHFSGIVAIAAFYTPDDHFRHVIVATENGAITEIFYGNGKGTHISSPALATHPGTVSVAAYYTASDKNRHVIAGLESGEIREIFYNPTKGVGDGTIALLRPDPLTVTDVSPNANNGITRIEPNMSGLTERIAGDPGELYAVSLNAGVWKSIAGGAWTRLANSPKNAYSIAVDPSNTQHVLVGERGGDSLNPKNDQMGVWETTNGGAIWSYVFNPLSISACSDQTVSGVALTAKGSALAATTCGIVRRTNTASGWSLSTTSAGLGTITAVVTSASKAWARTSSTLLVSSDDGATWSQKSIPDNMAPSDLGDAYSLGAFDGAAYMTCCSAPIAPCGNLNRMAIYDAASDKFLLQPDLFVSQQPGSASQLGCSGTRLGGSRFIKTYTSVGARRAVIDHLFYGSAQEVYEAGTLNSDSTVSSWTRPLGASCGGCTNQDQVHSDIWDYHVSSDDSVQWVSGDGGIYKRSLKTNGSWSAWTQQDDGLHTHHIHTLSLMRSFPLGTPSLAYATSDNDAWFESSSAGWASGASLGDANWTIADKGNASVAVLALRAGDRGCKPISCAVNIAALGQALPNGKMFMQVSLNGNQPFDGPKDFNFVQSLADDAPAAGSLDAIMLAQLPLQYYDLTNAAYENVPGSLGTTSVTGAQNGALLRNQNFLANPDLDVSQGQGWILFANNLASGTQAFWTTGGHSSLAAVIYAQQSDGGHIYKTDGSQINGLTQWSELNVQGKAADPKPWPPSALLGTTDTYGPVFVNPYNPLQIYALTASGVRVSNDGGSSFQADSVLTQLITANGQFPLTNGFSGGDGTAVRLASRAVGLGTLADMDFCATNPDLAVAASPFTGAFFKDEHGTWHNLTALLPHPLSSVSSVRLDCQSIYVATEGGGVTKISGLRNLP
jgi:hypothetical protein